MYKVQPSMLEGVNSAVVANAATRSLGEAQLFIGSDKSVLHDGEVTYVIPLILFLASVLSFKGCLRVCMLD